MIKQQINIQETPEIIVHKPFEKTNKYIEIVTIPTSTKKIAVGIDLNAELILEILSKNYEKVCITIIKNEDDLKTLVDKKPDLVFSGIKYFEFKKEKIWLSDCLKNHNIDYISSNKNAFENEYDKNLAKEIVQKENINTAKFFTTQPDEHETESSLPVTFPLFLKPVEKNNPEDINAQSVVFDFKKYQAKVLDIYNNQKSRTLVENYLSGKEYSVSIIENKSKNILVILPVEIIAVKNKNGHKILDFDARKSTLEEVTEVIDKKIKKELCLVAINSFRALGGKTIGKISIKMSFNGILHFLEADFMPSLDDGYFYKAFQINENLSYDEMILRITNAALSSPKEEI